MAGEDFGKAAERDRLLGQLDQLLLTPFDETFEAAADPVLKKLCAEYCDDALIAPALLKFVDLLAAQIAREAGEEDEKFFAFSLVVFIAAEMPPRCAVEKLLADQVYSYFEAVEARGEALMVLAEFVPANGSMLQDVARDLMYKHDFVPTPTPPDTNPFNEFDWD